MKNKRLRSVLIAALAGITVFVSACGKKNPSGENGGVRAEYTDFDFVKDGKTDYKILLSASPTETERYAAGELSEFIGIATGARIQTVSETGSEINYGKYLSVGDTAFSRTYGIDATGLKSDGFKISLTGNSVAMAGAGESGKLYAAYDFLEEQFGFEVYAADETYIESTENAKLKNFDVTEEPDFEGRDVDDVSYRYGNATFAARKRLRGVNTSFSAAQGEGSVWSPTLFCHSTHILLRPALYMSEHRDWFSTNGLDICYGTGIEDSESGAAMRAALTENLKRYIEIAPTAKYFMIGLEDNSGSCSCDKCAAANEKYGGEYARMSGTMLVFVNKIAREIKSWLENTYPARAEQVKIGMFAYQDSEQPPVTLNRETGEYAFSPEVKPEENVFIRLAPLSSVYSKSLFDETANRNIRETILGWSAMGAKLSVWSYNCPFGAYLYPFYGWHVFQENYRIFKQIGVTDILDQGPRESSVLPFQALRDYLLAELMWDSEQDCNALIAAFMQNYFKAAAPYMLEYFNLINANYALAEKTQGYLQYVGAWESRDHALAKYYPKSYLNRCLELFEKAYAAIDGMPESAEKEKTLRRVQKEELSPRYIELDQYLSYYDEETARTKLSVFETDASKLGLSYYAEGALISSKYAQWKNLLNE